MTRDKEEAEMIEELELYGTSYKSGVEVADLNNIQYDLINVVDKLNELTRAVNRLTNPRKVEYETK